MTGQDAQTLRLPHIDQHRNRRRTGAMTVGLHRHRICDSTGKIRYRDSHQAAHALENARRLAAAQAVFLGEVTRHEVRSYRCDSCGGFHLTSHTKGLRGQRAAHGQIPADDPVIALLTGGARRRRIAAIAAVAAASAA